MTNIDYVKNYHKSINKLNAELEEKAVKAIKEYGKEIDVVAIKAHEFNLDITDDDDDGVMYLVYNDCEYGNVETRDYIIRECAILGVRYNKETDKIEALMRDYEWDGTINDWMDVNYLCRDTKMSVYVTILEFIDQAKELNS